MVMEEPSVNSIRYPRLSSMQVNQKAHNRIEPMVRFCLPHLEKTCANKPQFTKTLSSPSTCSELPQRLLGEFTPLVPVESILGSGP